MRVSFHKIFKKIAKSAVFDVEKPLEMDPDLQKFWKNPVKWAFFDKKNPYIWVGVSDLKRHTLSKNNLSTPLDIILCSVHWAIAKISDISKKRTGIFLLSNWGIYKTWIS